MKDSRYWMFLFAWLYAFTMPGAVTLSSGFFLLFAIAALTLLYKEGRRFRWRPEGLETLFALYLGVAILSAAAGVDPHHSLRRLKSDFNMVWSAFILAAAFAVEPMPQLALASAAGFAVQAFIGIGDVAFNSLANETLIIADGTIHHVTFGELMAFGLLGATAAWAYRNDSRFRGRSGWILAFAALMGVGLILSQTRGAWLACAAGLATIGLLQKETRKLVGGAFLAAALIAVTVTPIRARFLSIFDPAQRGSSVRLELWQLAVDVFHESPVLGVGPGNFGTRLKELHPLPFRDTMKHTQAHNLYLHQLAERGFVGLAALLALLSFLWWRAFQRYRHSPDFASLWLLASLHALFLMCVTEDSFQKATIWMFVTFLWVWTMRSKEHSK